MKSFAWGLRLAGCFLFAAVGWTEIELSPQDLPKRQRPQAALPVSPAAVEQRPSASFPAVQVATNAAPQVRFDLVDGSILLGHPLATELPVQTAFALMKIPVTAIDTIEFTKGTNTSKLKLKNGDALQGVIQAPTFRLDTSIGRVELRQELITRLRVKLVGATEGIHLRIFLDGMDELHIQGETLWYVHRSWRKPGDGDESKEQTFINGKPWSPTWNGNVSDKFRPLEPALPDRGNYRITLENVKARGDLKVSQSPTADNNYKAVILLDDGGVPGQDWYEFTIRWEP